MSILTMITKMGEGLGRTCAIFFLTLLFSLPLGLIISLLRMSKNKIVSTIAKVYISILRGTPLMLQLLAVTYGPYYLFGIGVSREKLIPVVIAFALNYAAYFAEIYRGGIESMGQGHQRDRDAGQGYVSGVHRGLSGNVHHRQTDRELPDQFSAFCDRRHILLPVQRDRRLGDGTV